MELYFFVLLLRYILAAKPPTKLFGLFQLFRSLSRGRALILIGFWTCRRRRRSMPYPWRFYVSWVRIFEVTSTPNPLPQVGSLACDGGGGFLDRDINIKFYKSLQIFGNWEGGLFFTAPRSHIYPRSTLPGVEAVAAASALWYAGGGDHFFGGFLAHLNDISLAGEERSQRAIWLQPQQTSKGLFLCKIFAELFQQFLNNYIFKRTQLSFRG